MTISADDLRTIIREELAAAGIPSPDIVREIVREIVRKEVHNALHPPRPTSRRLLTLEERRHFDAQIAAGQGETIEIRLD